MKRKAGESPGEAGMLASRKQKNHRPRLTSSKRRRYAAVSDLAERTAAPRSPTTGQQPGLMVDIAIKTGETKAPSPPENSSAEFQEMIPYLEFVSKDFSLTPDERNPALGIFAKSNSTSTPWFPGAEDPIVSRTQTPSFTFNSDSVLRRDYPPLSFPAGSLNLMPDEYSLSSAWDSSPHVTGFSYPTMTVPHPSAWDSSPPKTGLLSHPTMMIPLLSSPTSHETGLLSHPTMTIPLLSSPASHETGFSYCMPEEYSSIPAWDSSPPKTELSYPTMAMPLLSSPTSHETGFSYCMPEDYSSIPAWGPSLLEIQNFSTVTDDTFPQVDAAPDLIDSPPSSGTLCDGVKYESLDFINFEFRLLRLLEPARSEDEAVCCTIDHAYLDDPPQYHALSYCWGDPSVTLPIQVNGKSVQVTTNLEAALRELRAQKIMTIWVDALCINQKDAVERSLQVMRMGLIYSRAAEVLAWLGTEADDSDSAMKQLADLKDPNWDAGDHKHILDLFGRPYWKRVWIIQEISKARELQVLCGNQRISWDQLTSTFGALGSTVLPELRTLEQFRVAEGSWKGTQKNSPRNRFDLLQALVKTKHCISTDDRDKIYALLGLTIDGAEIVPTPNYIRPAQSVYFQTFKEIISRTPELKYILNPRKSRRGAVKYPDWTDLELGIVHWVVQLVSDKSHSILSKSFPVYCESQQAEELPYLSESGLQISGRILDSIESISSSLPPQFNKSNIPLERQASASHYVYHDFSPGKACETRVAEGHPQISMILTSLWRAFTTAANRLPLNPLQGHLPQFDHVRASYAFTYWCKKTQWRICPEAKSSEELLSNWLYQNRNLAFFGQTLERWIELYSESKSYKKGHRTLSRFGTLGQSMATFYMRPVEEDISAFLKTVCSAVDANQRLAVSKLSFLALVPPQTQIGDVLCLLRHCSWPIVLRPQGKSYLFIGKVDNPLISLSGGDDWDQWMNENVKAKMPSHDKHRDKDWRTLHIR